MAAWHVEFSIVPRRAINAAKIASPGEPTAVEWGTAANLPVDYARHLTAAASPGASPNGELQRWGTEDGNRIDVWSVAGRATTISAFVDVRKLDSKFGAMLLQFVRVADAVLVRRDGLIVEPVVGAFGAALRGSAAWRYANDPAEHIAKYRDANDEES